MQARNICLIHPIFGEGDPFKLLGCLVDCKLQMHDAVEKILSEIRPKIKALLRTRRHYDATSMISQFKTHIWSIMEQHNGAIFHAAASTLEKLDATQNHFLHEIGMDEAKAFLENNFAPPTLRRNIGILGLLHKRVLGKSHPIFQRLLPFHRDIFGSLRPAEHDRQLYGHIMNVDRQQALHDRSIFAMVYVYNKLPQHAVDCNDVSSFQHVLTSMVRERCKRGDIDWQTSFSVNARRRL